MHAYGALVKRLIAAVVLKLYRTRIVGDSPTAPVCVLVCAPHTSNWDLPLMLAISWANGLRPVWMGKKELFKGPMGWIMRRLGGIAIDRDDPSHVVQEIVQAAKERESMAIVIPAEGTRGKAEYWKSGFRRIAAAADIPLVLAFVGGPDNTCGFGPTLEVTEDVSADMDILREFYADKAGLRPKNFTPPLLREEERTQE